MRFPQFSWKGVGFIALLVVVFIVGSMAAGGSNQDSYPYAPTSESYGSSSNASIAADDYDVAYEEGRSLTATPSSSDTSDSVATEARLIKTANLTLTVKDTEESLAELSAQVDDFGGYVQSSSTWVNSDDSVTGYLLVRVDVSNFEAFLEKVRSMATVVESESISGQDVTSQYIDLQARLTNLEAEEAQYLTILQEATTVEELLMVSDYLSTVRGEIELIQGQLKYLTDQTDYSTVTVYFYEEVSLAAPTSDWQPVVEMKEAVQTLIVLAQQGVTAVIWVVVLGIPALMVLGLGRMVWHRIARRGKSRK